MLPSVFVIVLCHNGIDLTLDCLASLQQQDYPALRVLLVDNASRDGTAETVRQRFPGVEVIATGANLGYVGGNNVGMQAALAGGAQAMFLLNNDTCLEVDCVSALVRTLEADPRVGILGPMVYDGAHKPLISSAGGHVDWRNADAVNLGAGEPDQGQYPARTVDFINGCGLMVTSPAARRAGLLDRRYFMYWEETDWCQRVRRAGFDIRFEPGAHMCHKATGRVSELSPTTLYYVSRNRLLFFALHTPVAHKAVTLARALHGLGGGILLHRRAGRLAHARATEMAVWHALLGRWGRYDAAPWAAGPSARPVENTRSPSGLD